MAHPSSAGKQRAGGLPLWRRQGPPLDFPGVPHSRGFAAEGRRRGCVATRQPLPFRPPVRRTALHLATQIFVGRGFRAFCVPSLLSGSHDIRTRRAAPFLSRRRSCEVFEFSRHTSARPAWSRANPEPARQPIRRILKPAHHVVTGTSFYYYAEDMLGSSRSLTTSTGSLCYDADFYPFGGEHQFTNSCPQNYKFTGKERDAETGNDDYDARYYSSAYGRFLSADWSAVPAPVPYANLTNPQTLNLYAMVSDNPETFADLDGHVNPSPDDPRRGPCADSGTTVCGQQQQQSAQSSAAQAQTLAAQVPREMKAAIANALNASNAPTATDKKGGYHEESVKSGKDSSGNVVVSPAVPGPYAPPGTAPHTNFKPADPKLDEKLVSVDVLAHIHPRGGADQSYVQGPSQVDIDGARGSSAINLVVGAADRKVYFYNGSGQIGKPMKFKDFMGGP